MRRKPSFERWQAQQKLARRALQAGAQQPRLFQVNWDLSGSCLDPQVISREERDPITWKPLEVNLYTRCRRCRPCLWAHRSSWGKRAAIELARSERSWWCTMTLRPDEQLHVLHLVRAKAASINEDFEAYNSERQWSLLAREAFQLVTLYLKRVRKRSGAKFRYLVVCEAHKSGLPHFHLFLHQQIQGGVVTWRHLAKNWTHGFYKFKLVDEEDHDKADYICKYLGKSYGARVRASRGYGAILSIAEAWESTHERGAEPNGVAPSLEG